MTISVDATKIFTPNEIDRSLLAKAKQEEQKFVKKKKLTKLKIQGGYVLTTEPHRYKHLERE
jgi:hypothetical protein